MATEFEIILAGLKGAKKGKHASVATDAGISDSYLTQLLNKHRKIKLESACIIAKAAGTSLAEILGAGATMKKEVGKMDKDELYEKLIAAQDEIARLLKIKAELEGELRALERKAAAPKAKKENAA